MPAPRRRAELTIDQRRAGIRALQRRLNDILEFDPGAVRELGDGRLRALDDAIDETLARVFGQDALEYEKYRQVIHLGFPASNFPGKSRPDLEGFRSAKATAVAQLERLIESFQEAIEDEGPDERARAAFADLDLHPAIRTATESQLAGGHHADAVRNACLALDALVHAASGRYDKYGTELMMDVFSPDKPALAFNELRDEADKSEQKGMMLLYAGAMLAMRNRPAHKVPEYDAERAVEAIAFISFLAKHLGRAKKLS